MIIKDLLLTYISPLTYYFTLFSSPSITHSPLQNQTTISSLSPSLSSNYLGFYNPLLNPSGSLLNRAVLISSNPEPERYLGEPLNIIISNLSSPSILAERGFIDYSRSLGQWNECARIHLGQAQDGNLGDGNGSFYFLDFFDFVLVKFRRDRENISPLSTFELKHLISS